MVVISLSDDGSMISHNLFFFLQKRISAGSWQFLISFRYYNLNGAQFVMLNIDVIINLFTKMIVMEIVVKVLSVWNFLQKISTKKICCERNKSAIKNVLALCIHTVINI